MMEGARVAPTDKKRHAPDFALWKRSKPEEPSWDSPWGPGRPGWHIECSAMSADKLGIPFDIHGGGKDLIFPHHENEIAQSEAGFGKTFCNAWMHNGFVTVDGVKMSKSLGNFISIKEGLQLAPPEVWRLLVLSTHYANPIDFSRTREVEAKGDEETETVRGSIDIAWDRLEYFYETLLRAETLLSNEPPPEGAPLLDDPRVRDTRDAFVASMDDDFNAARAVAGIGESMRYVNELCDMKAKKIKKLPGGRAAWLKTLEQVSSELKEVGAVLCILTKPPGQALEALRDFAVKSRNLDRAAVESKIAAREEARAAKSWDESDRLRNELIALGVEIRDTPTGTEWKVLR
jgi:cysteinyl-tRNA synthetase